jgi:hypothetical protein
VNRAFRAGETVEDYCRACKTDRYHTVIVVDGTGRPIRVSCDHCDSQHNFRGGPRLEVPKVPKVPGVPTVPKVPVVRSISGTLGTLGTSGTLGTHGERTGVYVSTSDSGHDDLELLLRRIIREETGLTPVAPAAKWRGGTLVLRPGTPGLQEKSWPIETFFHKVVMLRNRLRTLEQQVNASDLPDEVKIKLQGYVSGCYGSLTSFNVLFADEADQFKGSGGD